MHLSEMMSSTNDSWFHILLIDVRIIAVNSNKAVLLNVSELQFGKRTGRGKKFRVLYVETCPTIALTAYSDETNWFVWLLVLLLTLLAHC